MTYLEPIVGPAAELHHTGLLVEGEILDVHLAGAVVDGGGFPGYVPSVIKSCLGCQCYFKVSISTENVICMRGGERKEMVDQSWIIFCLKSLSYQRFYNFKYYQSKENPGIPCYCGAVAKTVNNFL